MINITYKTVAEKATKEFYKQVILIYLAGETHYIASNQRSSISYIQYHIILSCILKFNQIETYRKFIFF